MTICTDCGLDVDSGPCPAHPKDEYLGYLMGEGVSWRKAGQHSIQASIVDTETVTKDALKLLKRAERMKAEEEIRVWQRGSHRGYVR